MAEKKTFNQWVEGLSTGTKLLTAIVSISGIIVTYMTFHDNKVIQRYESINEQKEVKEQLTRIINYTVRDSVSREREILTRERDEVVVDSLIGVINLLSREVSTLNSTNKKLNSWLILNASTKDDIREIMYIFNEEKKN